MLHYFGYGFRNYYSQPIHIKQRACWEFQAILSGKCTLRYSDSSIPVEEPSLWVFRPGIQHGWSSRTKTSCEIVVFHFDYVPDVFSEYIGSLQVFDVPLDTQDIEILKNAVKEVKNHSRDFSYESLMHYDILVHELSLLVIKKSNLKANCENPKPNVDRIKRALSYYREHMSEKIGVEDVANSVSCSVSHLRRLFHSVLGISIKRALLQEQLHLAADRLKDPYCTVAGVANICGFSCASSFSRAFRNQTGVSPSQWKYSHPRQNPNLNIDS